jgi:putative SbcD/Mre11-related phosphoesterase
MITPIPPYPAALLRTHGAKVIVIADLHIGWELSLSKEGIHVPSQTHKLLKKLVDVLSEHEVREILVLGDVKHTVATAEKTEWRDVPDFFSGLKELVPRISVIRGNHDGNLDPLLPEGMTVFPATGEAYGDVGFFHGHRWPSAVLLKCKTLVIGHVHPVVVFRDPAGLRVQKQVWVKAACDGNMLAKALLQRQRIKVEGDPGEAFRQRFGVKPRTQQLLIMPSFNDFLGGRPLNSRRVSSSVNMTGPLLRSDAVDMKNAEAYLLDGTLLGTIEQLKALS